MNTGIGDAIDLGWKLDAVLSGWADPALLESYERERKPIAIRNSTISANNSDKIDMVMDETPPEVEAEGEAGERVRREVRRKIVWMARQFNSAGTHLGYRYVDSPVIVPDATPEPPDDFMQVVPSTWPGSRAPHGWLTADTTMRGSSTLDWFGRDWVLVMAPSAPDPEPMLSAFRRRGIAIGVKTLPSEELVALYRYALVLVRPDGHVAWRGNAIHPDPAELVEIVRGARVD